MRTRSPLAADRWDRVGDLEIRGPLPGPEVSATAVSWEIETRKGLLLGRSRPGVVWTIARGAADCLASRIRPARIAAATHRPPFPFRSRSNDGERPGGDHPVMTADGSFGEDGIARGFG